MSVLSNFAITVIYQTLLDEGGKYYNIVVLIYISLMIDEIKNICKCF